MTAQSTGADQSRQRPTSSPIADIINRQQAIDKARESAVPEFRWIGKTEPFKSRCFSDVCLGDDVSKLSSLGISWLDGGYTHPSKPNLQQIDAALRGLNHEEQATLASAQTTADGTGTGDIIPPGRFDYIVINANVLNILKKASLCAVLPVHGAFKSESGHYTSVLLMPANGKLVVVRIARQWILDVPPNASAAQQTQAVVQQLTDLRKLITDTYSGSWLNQAAVSDDTVGYYSEIRPVHPKLTLYARSFAAYQSGYDGSFQTFNQRREQGRGSLETTIEWDKAKEILNQTLSAVPGCAVKPPTVKAVNIN